MTAPPAAHHTEADIAGQLTTALTDIIRPGAVAVDATGAFPRAGLDALAEAGALGLLSSRDVGGAGGSLADMASVIERVAAADGSTAMVLLMHYAATAVLEVHGPENVRKAIARGEHLSTLAFSESGSRNHFWVPMSSATPHADHVQLDAAKSWVTSAGEADSYVWSSRPLRAAGPMTLWLVPADTPGLVIDGPFDGVGLRGNSSQPIEARGVHVSTDAQLGADGEGLTTALATALPTFLVGNAAFSLGLMRALLADASTHLTHTRLEHLGASLAEQPVTRADFARLRMVVDGVEAFLADTLAALGSGRADAMLRVLEVKAVAAEAAVNVADGVMRLCGGAAFRKELGVERRLRDALAARVMAPTTAALHDFVGRISLGMPLFDETAA